jgi:hypothetical protein
VLERLTPDYDVTVFFCNPNIQPFEEYQKRLTELRRFSAVPVIADNYFDYLPESCEDCFRLRLEETAKHTVAHGFDLFTTTLTASSKKNADKINEIAAESAKKYSTERLWADFKKGNGYNRSIELCNQYNIYRQVYCGCKKSQSNNRNS